MRLSEFDKEVDNVSRLADRPNIENGYTATELKAIFDKAGCDIKDYINNVLIEELASDTLRRSGADRIGSGEIDTLTGRSVQEKLECLSARLNELADGTIPEGSITPDKFSPEIEEFLTSASVRARVFTEEGEYSFTVERDGIYKVTVVGGGAGGGLESGTAGLSMGGGSGAAAIAWKSLSVGDVCTARVGRGGNGLSVDGVTLTARASAGDASSFAVNGATVITAEGGALGLSSRARASGGDINSPGSMPKAREINSYDSRVIFRLGGDSLIGGGCCFKPDIAGPGGGGFGAYYYGSSQYDAGTDGGCGAVIVEYLQ